MSKQQRLVGHGTIKRDAHGDLDKVETMKKESSQMREIKKTTDDELAGDTFFYKNFHLSKVKEKHPQNPELWTVDKYYPHAKGGPLYMDRIVEIYKKDKDLIKTYAKKKEVMKELGLKYIQWDENMEVLHAKEMLA